MSTLNEDLPVIFSIIPVGLLTKEDFLQGKYKSWFEEEYNAYQPKPSVVKKIKKLLDGIHIKAFFGTWYHDSHRELPRFFKTTDLAGFNVKDHFEMVGLTREKKYPIIFKRFLISRIRQPLSSTKTGKKLVVT